MDDLSRIIKEFKKSGMSQIEFAKKCKMANSTISRLFNGKQPLVPNTREILFEALGLNRKEPDLSDGVCGYIEFDSRITKINSYSDLAAITDSISCEVEDENTEIKKNGKPLLKDLLEKVPSVLKYADEFDVKGLHDFLKTDCDKPLIVISSGSTSSGLYLSLMYGMYDAVSKSITPYMANSLSDSVIKNSKIVLITKGGNDIDVKYIAERILILNPTNFAVITSSTNENNVYGKVKKNYVLESIKKICPEHCFTHNFDFEDGFIAVNSSIFNFAMIFRAFNSTTVSDKIAVDLTPSNNFIYSLNDNTVKDIYGLPYLKRIKQFVILYGNLGEAVAHDIESKLVEGGLISCQMSDYRNFCHGRFTFISNHVRNEKNTKIQSDTAVVLLVTPREKHIVDDLRSNVIPRQMPIVIIESKFDNTITTVDLIIKSSLFCSEVSNAHQVNINSPMNYANISKTYPKSGVNFKEDFERYGNMSYEWEEGACCIELSSKRLKVHMEDNERYTCLGAGEFNFDVFLERHYPKGIEHQRIHEDEVVNMEIGGSCGNTLCCLGYKGWKVYPIARLNRSGVASQMKKDLERFGADTRFVSIENGDIVTISKLVKVTDKQGVSYIDDKKLHCDGQAHRFRPTAKYISTRNNTVDDLIDALDYIPTVFFYSIMKPAHKQLAERLRSRGTLVFLQINDTDKDVESYIRASDIIQFDKECLPNAKDYTSKYENKLFIELSEGNKIRFNLNNNGWNILRTALCSANDMTGYKDWLSSMLINSLYKSINQRFTIGELTNEVVESALVEAQNIAAESTKYLGAKTMIYHDNLSTIEPSDYHEDVLMMHPEKIHLYRNDEVSVSDMQNLNGFGIIGSVLGDVIGRAYEFKSTKDYNFKMFISGTAFSDDTVLTMSIAKWILEGDLSEKKLVEIAKQFGRKYPNAGYGQIFRGWLMNDINDKERQSMGNGSAMRVSPVGYYARTLEECLELAEISARFSHTHIEGIKGAQATAAAVFMARKGYSKDDIKDYITKQFGYNLERKIEDIRPTYKFEAACPKSVPESLICFLQSNSYEETIRNAISLGGDSDTMACIAGGMASATNDMRVPNEILNKGIEYLPNEFKNIIIDFTSLCNND